jgi:hypothetical protein
MADVVLDFGLSLSLFFRWLMDARCDGLAVMIVSIIHTVPYHILFDLSRRAAGARWWENMNLC